MHACVRARVRVCGAAHAVRRACWYVCARVCARVGGAAYACVWAVGCVRCVGACVGGEACPCGVCVCVDGAGRLRVCSCEGRAVCSCFFRPCAHAVYMRVRVDGAVWYRACACVRASVRASVRACVRACDRACVRTCCAVRCARARVRACMCMHHDACMCPRARVRPHLPVVPSRLIIRMA